MAKDDPDAYSPEESTKAQPQQVKPNPQPQPVPNQRKERVLGYLQSLDEITMLNFREYFHFKDLASITDDQINAIANYLNAQKK